MRLTGLESSNSSPKGEVSSTSSNQDSSSNHPKCVAKLSVSSANSLSPTKNSPKTPQLQSINYYESYFDDSYVGDFTGEVPSDAKLDSDEVEQDWPNVSEINSTSGVIEFTYDSFGPESIVFPNGIEETFVPTEIVNGKAEGKVNDEQSDIEQNSPSKSEAADKCDNVLPKKGNFLRNSTLTISQRKKLSPQINFTDIMNTSDDVTPSLGVHNVGDEIEESIKNEQRMNELKTRSPDLEVPTIEG